MNPLLLKVTQDQIGELSETQMFTNLASLLSPQNRLRLFEEYCNLIEKRIPERIMLETGINKNRVYTYLPRTQSKIGGHIPDPEVTAKIILALLKRREYDLVIGALDPARNTMRINYLKFDQWSKKYRKRPFSKRELT